MLLFPILVGMFYVPFFPPIHTLVNICTTVQWWSDTSAVGHSRVGRLPAVEKLPGEQATQDDTAVFPVPAWDVPAAHRAHALWPVEDWYVPVGQEEQAADPLALA